MSYQRLQTASFFILLLLAFVLVLLVLKPFVNVLALGVILAILFHPIYSRLSTRFQSPNVASLLTLLLILLIILIPLGIFGQVLFNEATSIYNKVSNGDLVIRKDQLIQSLPPQAQDLIESASVNINDGLARMTGNAFQTVTSLVSNVANFFLSTFLLFFILFFLLRDGEKIKRIFMDISPMATSQENKLLDKIILAVNGVVKGSFLTALAQGIIATIGFLIFGVPEPFLWGAFTVMAALVPTIGTAISLVPAVAYLVITGHFPQAIGLAIWAVVAVGLIDNFLGPKLVGARAKLHPMLVLLSVLGGVQFFGFLGFLLGPILMAIFVALIDMYRTDFKEYMHS